MRLATLTLVIAVLLAAVVGPAMAGPAVDLLPEDTLFLMSVPSATASWDRLKAHPLHAMYREPDVQEFIAKPLSHFQELIATAAVTPREFLELVQGELSLAVTGLREVAKGTHYLGVVVVAEVGKNEAKFREKIRVAEPQAFDTGTHRRIEEEFAGATIVSYVPMEKTPVAEGEGVTSGPSCWFLDRGLFALSSDPEVLKGLLRRRADPEARGLAASENYRAILTAMGGAGDFYAYVDAAGIWTLVERMMAETTGGMFDSAMVMGILNEIGMREPKGLGVSIAITPSGMDQKLYLRSPTPRTGIMKLLDGANSALMPPRFVPPDVESVETVTIDFPGIWKEVRRLTDQIRPGVMAMVDSQFEGFRDEWGIDIEADLIGSLGQSITLFQFEAIPPDPDAEFPMAKPRVVFGAELSNAERMQEVLAVFVQKLGSMTMSPPETEEFQGTKLYAFDAGSGKYYATVAADHLLVATTKEDLRGILRGLGKEDAKSLLDSKDFRTAMEGLPRMRFSVSWSDPRRSVDSMSTQMAAAGLFMPELSEWLDVSRFPGETMKKYLNVTGGVVVNGKDGILMLNRARMQRPPAAEKKPTAPEKPSDPPK